MDSRDFLRAYLELKEAHLQLHKVLKAIEEDSSTSDILKRARTTRSTLDKAIAKIKNTEIES